MAITDLKSFHQAVKNSAFAAPHDDTTAAAYDPASDESCRPAARWPAAPAGFDAQTLALLALPALPGEPPSAHFSRKEHALGRLFSTLAPLDARALYHRLSSPRAGDAVSAAFERMNVERRDRLLVFLATMARRAAVRSAR